MHLNYALLLGLLSYPRISLSLSFVTSKYSPLVPVGISRYAQHGLINRELLLRRRRLDSSHTALSALPRSLVLYSSAGDSPIGRWLRVILLAICPSQFDAVCIGRQVFLVLVDKVTVVDMLEWASWYSDVWVGGVGALSRFVFAMSRCAIVVVVHCIIYYRPLLATDRNHYILWDVWVAILRDWAFAVLAGSFICRIWWCDCYNQHLTLTFLYSVDFIASCWLQLWGCQ